MRQGRWEQLIGLLLQYVTRDVRSYDDAVPEERLRAAPSPTAEAAAKAAGGELWVPDAARPLDVPGCPCLSCVAGVTTDPDDDVGLGGDDVGDADDPGDLGACGGGAHEMSTLEWLWDASDADRAAFFDGLKVIWCLECGAAVHRGGCKR